MKRKIYVFFFAVISVFAFIVSYSLPTDEEYEQAKQGVYNVSNAFWKIISGEFKATRRAETENFMAFANQNQRFADEHLLVVPKGKYTNFYIFLKTAPDVDKKAYFQMVRDLIQQRDDYHLATNIGKVGQQVLHTHIHLFGGKFKGDNDPEGVTGYKKDAGTKLTARVKAGEGRTSYGNQWFEVVEAPVPAAGRHLVIVPKDTQALWAQSVKTFLDGTLSEGSQHESAFFGLLELIKVVLEQDPAYGDGARIVMSKGDGSVPFFHVHILDDRRHIHDIAGS